MDFANNLKYLMENSNTSNYRLAKEIGCSPTTVANRLLGKDVTTEYQIKVAKYFNVSVDYLITGEKKPPTRRPTEK